MFGKIKSLFFNIEANDKTDRAFGSVNRHLRETGGLAASVNERASRAGRAMQRFGAVGSAASLGVAAAFRDVIGLYDEQARAEAKVTQAVRQTAGAAGFSAQELYRNASALQEITRFGDEAILNKVTAQLLTFGNISGQIFSDAQHAALDLATVLDGDLQSASIMLGKALNDPVKGLSAMSRAGITFSAVQADVIKDLARTGKIAEAQRLILDEIATFYGGQAEAARATGAGIVDAWRNTWGDVKEIIGGVLVDALPPVIDALKSLTGWFRDLTPEGQKTAVMLGALAVAIPPVTAALGLLVTGITALSGPVGLAIAGIAALTGAAALLWPEKDRVTQSVDLLTAATGDEMTQSQLLQQALSGDIAMSVSAAKQKLAEAQSRHENVKAIIAEQRALKLQSTDYQSLLGQIADAQAALNATGFPARDSASAIKRDAFEAAQQRLADLLRQQQDFLKADAASADQLKRTEENIAALEDAIANASGGMVSFGNGMVIPIETAERLKSALVGGGGGGGSGGHGSLADALDEVTGKTEDFAQSGGWSVARDNMKALLVEGQSWSTTWQNIMGSAVDRLFDLAFTPAWNTLFANLEGAMSGMGTGGGGGKGFLGTAPTAASGWVGNVLGLDTGGDVTVSGRAGVDRNLTVLRTSNDEQVSVRRPGDSGGNGAVNVYIQTPNPQAFQSSRAQIGHQISRAVAAGNRIA